MENVRGPCRLPYDLLENDKKIDCGYLLSTKDLCGLDYIPSLIKCGVTCLKIEGRMKSPEYVATVTRIYRKYIDLAMSNNPYVIDSKDRQDLLQIFNRGMSSCGHLNNAPNKELVFKSKPNHMGLFLGTVQNYNKNKGYITVNLKECVNIGDKISVEKESGSYTISELMKSNTNIKETKIGETVVLGRIKGNINIGDKIYKISSKALIDTAKDTCKKENKKVLLSCNVTIKKSKPISIHITSSNNLIEYKNLDITYTLPYIPENAKNKPLDKKTVITQISKTNSTPYIFKNINVDLDENIYLSKLSILNELRRKSLEEVKSYALSKIHRSYSSSMKSDTNIVKDINTNIQNNLTTSINASPKICVLLNLLNNEFDYLKLEHIDNIYIPFKYFINKSYRKTLTTITKNNNVFIYLPTVFKGNYKNLFNNYIKNIVNTYSIKGFVVSNIGHIYLLNNCFKTLNNNFEIIANYTFNVFNSYTILELKKLGICRYTISPELDKDTIYSLLNDINLKNEFIVYGKTPLLNMNYCLLR